MRIVDVILATEVALSRRLTVVEVGGTHDTLVLAGRCWLAGCIIFGASSYDCLGTSPSESGWCLVCSTAGYGPIYIRYRISSGC